MVKKDDMKRLPEGTLQFKLHTCIKLRILDKYLPALSTVVGKGGWPHYFIDACAGSGRILIEGKEGDGSPLIMAKARIKAKRPALRCIFIEDHPKTFERLKENVKPYSNFVKCIYGDCNVELDKALDRISGSFAFIFLDPYGLGEPAIQQKTIERIMSRPNTEILMNYSWEAVSRCAGCLRSRDSNTIELSDLFPEEELGVIKKQNRRKVFQKIIETLDLYHGKEWRQLEQQNLSPKQRREAYLELYTRKWRKHYRYIEPIEIPLNSRNPFYYLIFTSRHPLGEKIIKDIIEKERRTGGEPSQVTFDF